MPFGPEPYCGFGQSLILTERGHEHSRFSRQATYGLGQLHLFTEPEQRGGRLAEHPLFLLWALKLHVLHRPPEGIAIPVHTNNSSSRFITQQLAVRLLSSGP
jgi:hypothetical protein